MRICPNSVRRAVLLSGSPRPPPGAWHGHGIGVFAFVDAKISFDAPVAPGQIRNASVTAVLDLDKPEEAGALNRGSIHDRRGRVVALAAQEALVRLRTPR